MFVGPDLEPTGKLVYAYITYALMLTSYTIKIEKRATRAQGDERGGMNRCDQLISLFVRPLVPHAHTVPFCLCVWNPVRPDFSICDGRALRENFSRLNTPPT